MSTLDAPARKKPFRFRFHTCRNISGPEDVEAGRKILVGHAPASAYLTLSDNENVREYLVDTEGKKARPTLVHQAMRETLYNRPDLFSVLNGGICVVCQSCTIDEKEKVLHLNSPSIINGSQTQGELHRYFERGADGRRRSNEDPASFDPSVTFEIIVTDDDDLVADISIARNFQNDVAALSIAGRKGQLEELEEALRKSVPDVRLRKKESDPLTEDYLQTEKLIQVLFALAPDDLWVPLGTSPSISKVAAYSQKTRCLKEFQRIHENAKRANAKPADVGLYKYFLDMAATAWELYEEWKTHQGFKGTGLRSIERDDRGNVTNIPDGIVFPILAAMSAFVHQKRGRWVLTRLDKVVVKDLIEAAKEVYMEVADHNPQTMGKSKACYSGLHRVTTIYAKMNEKED